jgi:uncharacterized lipoprotein YajG
MTRLSSMLCPAFAAALLLAGCATPEQLAANDARRAGYKQTGTNIIRADPSGRVTGTSDQDANQRMIDDLRNAPGQSAVPRGAGG